jgi:hypothetical protein
VAIEGIGPVSYSGMPREMRVNGLKPVFGKAWVLYRCTGVKRVCFIDVICARVGHELDISMVGPYSREK